MERLSCRRDSHEFDDNGATDGAVYEAAVGLKFSVKQLLLPASETASKLASLEALSTFVCVCYIQ